MELATFLDSRTDQLRKMANEDSMNIIKQLGRATHFMIVILSESRWRNERYVVG